MSDVQNAQNVNEQQATAGEWVCRYELLDRFMERAEKICNRTAKFQDKPTLAKAVRLISDYHDLLPGVLGALAQEIGHPAEEAGERLKLRDATPEEMEQLRGGPWWHEAIADLGGIELILALTDVGDDEDEVDDDPTE